MLYIGSRIQEYRKKAELSQEEFADKIGVSRQAVSNGREIRHIRILTDLCVYVRYLMFRWMSLYMEKKEKTG